MFAIISTKSADQLSSFKERTRVICLPKALWAPAQFMQIMIPKSIEAQAGPLDLQSAHILL